MPNLTAPASADSADPPAAPLGCLSLAPRFVERVWGSHDLGPWFPPATGAAIGEAWLTATECLVEAGPEQGSTLGALLEQHPRELARGSMGEFPLLIKVLFPKEKLSVQVHPDDARAHALGLPNGKTECWYILSAEPGATVAVGLREPLTPAAIRAAIEQGTLEQYLNYLPVKAGDMVFVDAGTIHAVGPGVIVLETQQYSDTTYRLFDYGRPRELHIEAGLAATKNETRAGLAPPKPMEGFTRLIDEQYFFVDRFDLEPGVGAALGGFTGLQIVVALGVGATLNAASADAMPLQPGHAVVLPVGAPPSHVAATEPVQVIRIGRP